MTRGDDGYALLETVAAVMVAGLFMAAVLPALADNRLRLDRGEDRLRATMIGEAAIQSIAGEAGWRNAVREGSIDGFDWQLTLADLEEPDPVSGRLMSLSVTVRRADASPLFEAERLIWVKQP